MKRFVVFCCFMTIASSASAQINTWSAGIGAGSAWLRDVSRTTRPVDASPVAWKGRDLVLEIDHDRRAPNHTHHFDAVLDRSSRFVYDTPLGDVARPSADGGGKASARYEYRRFVRDVGVRGFDLAFGASGGVAQAWTSQHFDPDIAVRGRLTEFNLDVAAGARISRWRQFELQVFWSNGGTIGRKVTMHSLAADDRSSGWGGGWLTDLRLRADVPVRKGTSIFGSFYSTGRGRFASHDAFASGRRHILIGVSHGF